MSSPSTCRPALRALVFGVLAALTRAATLLGVVLATASDKEHSFDLVDAWWLLEIANPLGTVLALVGVAYAAIAAHRREWGATLVAAWVLNVAAALYIPGLFVYATF